MDLINEYYKNDIKNIKEFLSSRPKVIGCYCYGIGETLTKKIYRLFLVTDNIWKWQQKNNRKNESNKYINFLSTSGYNFVEYLGIKENNSIFDYTLINQQEFIDSLLYWKFFTFAEIFQKPFIKIKSNSILDRSIKENQRNALTTSLLMGKNVNGTFFDLMLKLYCISGCLTSDKIDLVCNNYQFLKDIYQHHDSINIENTNSIIIYEDKLKDEVKKLPAKIKKYIYEFNGNIEIIGARNYFEKTKAKEKSIINDMRYLVNGIVRTFDYNGRVNKVKILKKDDRF